MAELYGVRKLVSGRFYEHHVVQIKANAASTLRDRDLEERAKTEAERMYLARDVDISTLLVFGQQEANMLRAEVTSRQALYEAAFRAQYPVEPPDDLIEIDEEFTSLEKYPHLSRGSRPGEAPGAKKQAKAQGNLRFVYKVARVRREDRPDFKIDHYHGVAD